LPEGAAIAGGQLREMQAPDRLVWIAGSTHEGEEDLVLDAHLEVQKRLRNALLVLVPRHPNRFESVASALRKRSVRFVSRSSGARVRPDTEVWLADSLGELVTFYAASDVALVAGSLVPIGGHNLLEPAALGLPILTGPYNFNGEDVARLLLEVGAVRVVHDAAELARQVATLLGEPSQRQQMGSAGRRTLDANRGATQRLLDLIDPLLNRHQSLN
jgi:3-deoxy-D-manno-octulosonic-acid transferase